MKSHTCRLALLLLCTGFAVPCPAQNLRDTTLQADYVILCTSSNQPVAERLAQFRRIHSNLTSRVVSIESVYTQFHAAAARDSSLREFIRFAVRRWRTPAPRYFLLAGNVNQLPPHKEPGFDIPRQEDSVCVDAWYVEEEVASSTALACLAALGRLPAWTAGELDTVISKMIAYEQAAADAWMGRSLVLADCDSSDETVFEQEADPLQGALAEAWPETTRIDIRLGSLRNRPVGEFLAAWNRGTAVVSYVGHGAPRLWSQFHYLTVEDVQAMGNGLKLPVCFFVACSQSFDRRDSASIVQTLLLQPGGGAVATLAAAGLAFLGDEIGFMRSVVARVCADPELSVGDAVRRTRDLVDYPQSLRRRFTLLGDPALVPRRWDKVAELSSVPAIPRVCVLRQNYPNPFNPVTIIPYSLSHRSHVTLTVFNALGQTVAELIDADVEAGSHEVRFSGSRLASGMYFYRLRAGSFVDTKQLCLIR